MNVSVFGLDLNRSVLVPTISCNDFSWGGLRTSDFQRILPSVDVAPHTLSFTMPIPSERARPVPLEPPWAPYLTPLYIPYKLSCAIMCLILINHCPPDFTNYNFYCLIPVYSSIPCKLIITITSTESSKSHLPGYAVILRCNNSEIPC